MFPACRFPTKIILKKTFPVNLKRHYHTHTHEKNLPNTHTYTEENNHQGNPKPLQHTHTHTQRQKYIKYQRSVKQTKVNLL